MKRKDLTRCAQEIATTLHDASYDDWATKSYPLTYEHEFEGKSVQVEIQLLEKKENYLQLLVSVYNGGLSAYNPPGILAIISNEQSSSAAPRQFES